jgi:phage baseplate assembly protein W
MPIPQTTRVDPLDLNKNTAIGVGLPFNKPGVFKSTFSTKDQTKSNIVNLLLTNKGERIMNPEFGADISYLLFEGMTDSNIANIQDKVTTAINNYIPQIIVDSVDVVYDQTYYTINITINYRSIISGTSDQVNVEFQ